MKKIPVWMTLSIDDQIQYQANLARAKTPVPAVIMVFTYDKNRSPEIQRSVIEL